MSKLKSTNTAPHQKWLDDLTLELRLKDFSGAAVGDALATVEEFLADSGQTPQDEFGTARDYAGVLAAAAQTKSADLRVSILGGAFSLVVFMVFSAALTPWTKGEQLLFGGVQLVCIAALAVLILLLPLYLSHLIRHFWALLIVPVVGVTVGVISAFLTPRAAADALLVLPAAPVLLISAALLIALSVAGTILELRGGDDSIRRPLDPDQGAVAPKSRFFGVLSQWVFPLAAVLLFGLVAVLSALR